MKGGAAAKNLLPGLGTNSFHLADNLISPQNMTIVNLRTKVFEAI